MRRPAGSLTFVSVSDHPRGGRTKCPLSAVSASLMRSPRHTSYVAQARMGPTRGLTLSCFDCATCLVVHTQYFRPRRAPRLPQRRLHLTSPRTVLQPLLLGGGTGDGRYRASYLVCRERSRIDRACVWSFDCLRRTDCADCCPAGRKREQRVLSAERACIGGRKRASQSLRSVAAVVEVGVANTAHPA
jgi:hypothetical protein